MPDVKLGLKPARPGSIKLKFADYGAAAALPTPPRNFGHYPLVKQFPMFGNDSFGDCFFAGGGHEHQLWRAQGRSTVSFTDHNILSAYGEATGFTPNDPNSDQGTDMDEGAAWRRKVGIADSSGARHKVSAYVDLVSGQSALDQIAVATYLFGAAGIGIEVPQYAMDQFDAGKPWDIARKNTKILGGHYIPVVGRQDDHYLVVTWGKLQPVTARFLNKYCDQGVAYLSTEILWGGKSIEGFNSSQLLDDLRHVASVRTPRPTATLPPR